MAISTAQLQPIVSAPAAISQKYRLSSASSVPRAERGASVRRTGLKDDKYQERRAWAAVLGLPADCAGRRFADRARLSAVDDRRRLVSNELPGATLAHPNRKIAIVNVHDRAGHQYLGRHPSGHERGAVDD